MDTSDTIVALSSPAGAGLRAIMRVTGPKALSIACAVADLHKLPANRPVSSFTRLAPPLPPVACNVLLWQGPRSFTGQDVAEFHFPGSPALVRMALDAAVQCGARPAGPGEFSARAFFAGKMDLTEAEGIAATISAASARELRAAASLRAGDLHKWVSHIVNELADALARVEAGIDFADEEGVSFITQNQLVQAAEFVHSELHRLPARALRIDRLSDPPTVVFIGKPNVGKSSLINALTRSNRAIVSPLAGTTRDVLAAVLHTPRGDIRLLDVAGEETPADELTAQMMAARTQALLEADLIVHVVAAPDHAVNTDLTMPVDYPAPVVYLQNKSDQLSPKERAAIAFFEAEPGQPRHLLHEWQFVSAKTGENLPELATALASLVTRQPSHADAQLVLNQRHRVLLQQAKECVGRALDLAAHEPAASHPELIAFEFRHALDLLGQITGTVSPDDILGRIFSRFCIGK